MTDPDFEPDCFDLGVPRRVLRDVLCLVETPVHAGLLVYELSLALEMLHMHWLASGGRESTWRELRAQCLDRVKEEVRAYGRQLDDAPN